MWDPAHVLGFWYKKEGHLVHKDQVVWDAYYLYASKSEWSEVPSRVIDAGTTVWDLRERLKKSVELAMKNIDK